MPHEFSQRQKAVYLLAEYVTNAYLNEEFQQSVESPIRMLSDIQQLRTRVSELMAKAYSVHVITDGTQEFNWGQKWLFYRIIDNLLFHASTNDKHAGDADTMHYALKWAIRDMSYRYAAKINTFLQYTVDPDRYW